MWISGCCDLWAFVEVQCSMAKLQKTNGVKPRQIKLADKLGPRFISGYLEVSPFHNIISWECKNNMVYLLKKCFPILAIRSQPHGCSLTISAFHLLTDLAVCSRKQKEQRILRTSIGKHCCIISPGLDTFNN